MKRIYFLYPAASSLLLCQIFLAVQAHSARRPRYGGTLRVEIEAAVSSLDPSVPPASPVEASAKEKLMALVFDRLTKLDEHGLPQPALAVSWDHDASLQVWQFHLRQNVKFHDGATLLPSMAAAVLAAGSSNWHVKFSSDAIQIETGSPSPELPVELSSSRYSIIRATANESLIGTGAFRIASWDAGRHAVFAAFDDDWEGRPFLDAIDVQMNRAARDRLIDLEVGKADFVEVPAEAVRKATDRGARVSASQPDELLALVFLSGHPAAEEPRIREALARSIDRSALVNFLLQKQGEPAWSLLPQWLSGAAFLFSSSTDPSQAKQLVSRLASAPALLLGYDGSNALEKTVAERIVVNARDAGIALSAQPANASAETAKFDARLLRLRVTSPTPRAALAGFLATLVPLAGLDAAPLPDPASAEEIYARERAVVDSFRVIPLVFLPETIGLSSRVRDWTAPLAAPGGGWPLADVWLEGESP